MAPDKGQPKEVDLDRTDELPIPEGMIMDRDVVDDAVPLRHAAVTPVSPAPATRKVASDLPRPPGVDLPTLTESVRPDEDRIARQSAEYEALNRLYENTRDAEAAAVARANALTADLAAAQSALAAEQRRSRDADRALAAEQRRSRDMDRTLAEKNATAEASRSRVDEILRDWERHQSELRTLRESLAARDKQLHALQREHAQVVPALEARSHAANQLEAQMQAARSDAEAAALESKDARQSLNLLAEKIERGEHELNATRQELSAVSRQADTYLEILRTREWRRGFDLNMFLDWDANTDTAGAGHGAPQAGRDRLNQASAALNGKFIEQEAAIEKLRSGAAAGAAALAKSAQALQESERAREELAARSEALEGERQRLRGELAAREQALAQAGALSSAETQKIAKLTAEAQRHEQEVTALTAQLNEARLNKARRPTESILADLKRVNDELALKTSSLKQLTEENRDLHATLERTRGALEERELLIRRLEPSEGSNANTLGRIQAGMERLGTTPAPPADPALSADWPAEFVRIDDGHHTTYALGRRTRVGRAPDCELHIGFQSVSRHHALLLNGPRGLIIEDLNSTNGVIVNGRKVSRLRLKDGDVVTIGEIQFRCAMNPAKRRPEAPSEPLNAGPHSAEP
jgi:FHA domain